MVGNFRGGVDVSVGGPGSDPSPTGESTTPNGHSQSSSLSALNTAQIAATVTVFGGGGGDRNPAGGTTAPNEHSKSYSRPALDTAQIAGTVVGVLVVILAILVTVYIIIRRRKRREISSPDPVITPYRYRTTRNVRGRNKQVFGRPGHQEQARRTERQVVYLNDSGWRPLSDSGGGVAVMPPRYDAAV
ncbi:hypothetical protein VNI00_014188 [Paramarasmius palmivorus]|uniref:Uncharacterized protein n=1 Tax=Paramarasmius palmivorus TaxID=297713 RepID=A0AAW0BV62_9AGAR